MTSTNLKGTWRHFFFGDITISYINLIVFLLSASTKKLKAFQSFKQKIIIIFITATIILLLLKFKNYTKKIIYVRRLHQKVKSFPELLSHDYYNKCHHFNRNCIEVFVLFPQKIRQIILAPLNSCLT